MAKRDDIQKTDPSDMKRSSSVLRSPTSGRATMRVVCHRVTNRDDGGEQNNDWAYSAGFKQ
jgi:hypothetical protein